jgi:hypothetical protein
MPFLYGPRIVLNDQSRNVSNFLDLTTSVTILGNFLPTEQWIALVSCLETTVEVQKFVLLSSTRKFVY